MHTLSFYKSAIRRRLWAACVFVGLFLGVFGLHAVQAAVLTKSQLQKQFGEAYLVGEKLTTLPVWPIFQRDQAASLSGPLNTPYSRATKAVLHAYAFETLDIEPVAGYGGKPINILVVMTPAGKFLEVRLLKQHEPIFQSVAANALLAGFAEQYIGLTVQHSIQILTPKAQRVVDDHKATLHGVTAGTVSVTAMDRTIMEAAAQVAYAKLDDPDAKHEAALPRGADDRYERMGWNQLVAAKLIQPISISNKEVEKRFADTTVAGLDAEGMIRPSNLAVDMWVSLAGLPQVGRNLFDAPGWREIRALRESGVDILAVMDNSRYTASPSSTNASGISARMARLVARQGEQRIELKELPFSHTLRMTGQHSGVGSGAVLRLFATEKGSKLNLMQAVALDLNLSRAAADVGQQRVEKLWKHTMTIPNVAAWQPVRETPAWWRIWEQRQIDLVILIVGLIVLSVALANQLWLSASQKRLTTFRVVYLVFTLGFVGWWAQGQLTIVNLTSLGGALLEGRSGEFLMSDPVAIILWAFVGITLFIWGRGTFCGWLCPFGALQELLNLAARRLGIKQHQFHRKVDAALKWFKYVVLATIVIAVLFNSPWVDTFVEIEPFKTSISMGFQREWPYVAWAIACLGLGLFVFRGYCRYICPLGAALAVMGHLRLWKWLPRRAECGTPCQTCRHGCGYKAIKPQGTIDYAECFQCLDCVTDYQDEQRCLPLIRERKGREEIPKKIIPIQPVNTYA